MTERLDLPFTGIATFARVPHQPDLAALDADVAVIGAPYDLGGQYRPGARLGPRGIRSASVLYGYGSPSFYDAEHDEVTLVDVRIVDCGDADMVHARPEVCLANIERDIRQIRAAGALPVMLGGDHSVTIPAVRAFSDEGPIYVVQVDAHLDYVDERAGVREGNGNVMRRTAEMEHVSGQAQIGIRGPGSTGPSDFDEARANGSLIVSTRELRQLGPERIAEMIPSAERYYVTVDIDVLDPALCPGVGGPAPGGLSYHEVTDLLRAVAFKGQVVGMDVVEVTPVYDASEVTTHVAARLILDFLGAIYSPANPNRPKGATTK